MEARANHLAVGAFALLLMIGVPAIFIWTSRPTEQNLVAHFIRFTTSVSGIAVGSNVLFGGIPIGHVTAVSLDPNTPTLARVDILVAANVPLYTDSKATLASQSLFSGVLIDISRTGGRHGRRLNPGEEIAPRYSPFGKLSVSIPEMVASADQLLRLAGAMFTDQNFSMVDHIFANIAKLRTLIGADASRFDNVRSEASDTFAQLRQAWLAYQQMDSGEIDKLAANAKVAQEEFGKLVSIFSASAAKFNGLIQDNSRPFEDFASAGFPQVSPMIDEVNRLVKNLKRLWTEATQDPARFFLTDRQEGFEPSARVNNRR